MPALRPLASALLALALAVAPGCDRLFDKGSKDDFTAAQKKAAAGDFPAAVQLYEASLDGTAKTAETHYKLALLYADKIKNPLDAIHHVDRYLSLAPAGAHAKDAANLRKESESKLRAKLSDGAPISQGEAIRLKKANEELHARVAALEEQKPAATTPASGAKRDPEKKPIPPGARTYTVKRGDTLAKIAREFYKNPARARDIQNANFNQPSGPVMIKAGMVLIIPK